MKILVVGDTHFSSRTPERRKDSILITQLKKMEYINEIFYSSNCNLMVQVGDFFDTPNPGNFVIAKLIRYFYMEEWNLVLPIYTIFGQHDVFGHTIDTFPRSPLAVMEAAGVCTILNENPVLLEDVAIYGTSFGQDIPDSIANGSKCNILVIHKNIGDRPLFPGHELIGPRNFLRKYPQYDVVLCGDYHYTFDDRYNDRLICNPGCLIRKTIVKHDLEHKPCVFILDTDTLKLEQVYLPIQEVEDVFDLSVEEKKKRDELIEFIEHLRDNTQGQTSWRTILDKVYDERKVPKHIKEELENIIHIVLETEKGND